MKKLYGMLFLSMGFMAYASHPSDDGRLPDDFKFRPADPNKRTNIIAQWESYKHEECRNKSGITKDKYAVHMNWQKFRERPSVSEDKKSSSYCVIS